MLAAQGGLAEALQSYEGARDILDLLSKADPSNAHWQYDLLELHKSVAMVLIEEDDELHALEELKQGREMVVRLSDPSLTKDLAWFDAEITKLETKESKDPATSKPKEAAQ